MKKRIAQLLLALCLVLPLLVVNAGAASSATSGTCGGEGDGSNLTWRLLNATLYIEGAGKMGSGTSLFSSWYAHRASIQSVIIKNGVTSIRARAFSGCGNLSHVDIPATVTSIEQSAFSECSSLRRVTIPASVTDLGGWAFDGCTSLTSVSLSSKLTTIQNGTFRNCTSLKVVDIPNGVTTIEWDAFKDCAALEQVTIPATVTSIGSGTSVFTNCGKLTSAGPRGASDYWKYSIRFGWTDTIPANAFNSCSALTSVTIPDTVTSIGERAFYYCRSLASVNIPDKVTSIAERTFSGCYNLASIEIPNKVTSIGKDAFSSCRKLTHVIIPSSVTSIGEGAFQSCQQLVNVQIPSKVTSIEKNTFQSCSKLASVSIPSSVTSIGENAFRDCSTLSDIYYGGSKKQWQRVTTETGNDALAKATVHYAKCDVSTRVEPEEGGVVRVSVTGGTFTPSDSYAIARNESITVSAHPNSNYKFTKWTENGVQLGTTDRLSITVTEDRNLVAHFTAVYTVTFDSQGGSTVHSVKAASGSTVTKPSNPSKDNFAFSGWYKEPTCENPWDFTSDTVTADITLYAKWVPRYTVTFDPNGGQVTATSMRTGIDGTLSSLPTPTRQCHSFEGWYTQDDKDNPVSTSTVFTSDTTVYAEWSESHTPEVLPRVEATCITTGLTEGSRCSICGTTLIEQQTIPLSSDHDWGDETSQVTTEATCGTAGVRTYTKTCRQPGCGATSTRTETIPATGNHNYQVEREHIDTPASCIMGGWKTVYYQCATCPATKEETEPVPLTGHTEEDIPYLAPTCGDTGHRGGKRCSVCNQELEAWTEIPATGHHTVGQELDTVETQAPTCTQDGAQTTSYVCSVCNHIFVVNSVIPATGHTEQELPAVPATCTGPGKTAGKECSVCHTVTVPQKDIDPLPHSWGPETSAVTKASTCTETGVRTYTRTCTACGEKETRTEDIPTSGHKEEEIPAVPATCTTPGKTAGKQCSVCHAVTVQPQEVALLAHSWGPEISTVTKAASCTQPGVLTYTKECTVCGETETRTEEIPAPGHTEEEIPAVPATCTTDGSTAGKKCSVCGEILEASQTVPAAHTDVELIPGKEASCLTDGLTQGSRCNACGTTLVEQKNIPALGHSWVVSGSGNETVTKEPTCTEDGAKEIAGSMCARCGAVSDATVTVVIPATGHSWGEETSEITAAATCTEEGIRTYTRRCTAEGCGEVETRTEAIPAAGHTYGQWTTTREPTATQPGARERVCTTCGDKQTETIPATGGSAQPEAPKTYTITFDPNGGTGGTTLTTGTDGRLSALPGGPTRSGYTFTGWYTAVSGGEAVTTSTVFQSSATVYARWREQPIAPSAERYPIYVPGYVSGGSVDASHSYAAAGTRVTIALSPRGGYELDWLEAVDLSSGRDLRLTRLYDDEYTFIMPASAVEVDLAFAGRYWYSGNSGGVVWSVPQQPPASLKPINWYFRDGQIWHVTDGLVPYSAPLTRDMLISILYNLDDTSAGEQVVWAAAEGIIPSVYPSGLWGTDKSISREQAAMILYCYAGHKGLDRSPAANLAVYRDYSQVRVMARQSLSWAQAAGLIPATSANRLSPRDTLSCGETNAILSRFVSFAARTA